jgi:carbonic anhydrase
VQRAWLRGQELAVHGAIYGLQDGILKDLNVRVTSQEQTPRCFRITSE